VNVRKLFDWAGVLLVTSISTLAFVAVLLFLRTFGEPLWSQEASGWAQAIGAVAAIYFSYRAGQKQGEDALNTVREADKIAAERKFNAVLAVVDTAVSYAHRISDIFSEGSASYLDLCIRYSERFMSDLMDALQVIPAHELGSYETVSAFLTLRNAMHDLRTNVNGARAKFEDAREGDAYPHSIQFDRGGVDLCITAIESAAEFLHKARSNVA
jgi:hypothetical protein